MKKINVLTERGLGHVRSAIRRYAETGQDTTIRAYKFVTKDLDSPYAILPGFLDIYRSDAKPIRYNIGDQIGVLYADANPMRDCGAGINAAPLDWCASRLNWPVGDSGKPYRYIAVEFKASDVAVIPNGTDGKFRLYRCKVVAELDVHGEAIAWLRNGKVVRRKMRKLDIRIPKDINALVEALNLYTKGGPDVTVRAYKFVTKDYQSVYPQWTSWSRYDGDRHWRIKPITYTLGSMVEVANANTDEWTHCSRGIHVAPFEWCIDISNRPGRNWGNARELLPGIKVVALEFKLSDIAVIPKCPSDYEKYSDKFRLFRATVVGEMDGNGKMVAWKRGKDIIRRGRS